MSMEERKKDGRTFTVTLSAENARFVRGMAKLAGVSLATVVECALDQMRGRMELSEAQKARAQFLKQKRDFYDRDPREIEEFARKTEQIDRTRLLDPRGGEVKPWMNR